MRRKKSSILRYSWLNYLCHVTDQYHIPHTGYHLIDFPAREALSSALSSHL